MSISIFISSSKQPGGSYSAVVGGTPSMSDLVDPVSDILEKNEPEIFDKAFQSLEWGEVHLDVLNEDEFKLVHSLTKKIFSELKESNDYQDNDSALIKNWNEYLEKLQNDPRS